VNIDHLIKLAAQHFSLQPEAVYGRGKNRDTVKARRIVCFWGVHRLGMTMTAVAKKLGVSVPTVSLSARKGERIARKEDISLTKMINTKI
jgi:chromosomal replication initiation ATPase DnaA